MVDLSIALHVGLTHFGFFRKPMIYIHGGLPTYVCRRGNLGFFAYSVNNKKCGF